MLGLQGKRNVSFGYFHHNIFQHLSTPSFHHTMSLEVLAKGLVHSLTASVLTHFHSTL